MSWGEQFFSIQDGQTVSTKLINKGYKYPVNITKKGDRLWLSYNFNKSLTEEIKIQFNAKWHGFESPPVKSWSIPDNQRSRFRLAFMEGKNPYAWYDRPLLEINTKRPTYQHQLDLFRHSITYRYIIIAAGMGLGKTLTAIEVMEYFNLYHVFYVAPRSALESVKLEFEKWDCKIKPVFMTYDRLRSFIAEWPEGASAPHGVIFDESSRLKNPTAKRTQAAQHLADSIRNEHGHKGFVIEMSGTPAPKSPLDWLSQSEIACPGFLKEADLNKARKRLAITSEMQSDAGQLFQKIVCWRDDERRCDVCGKFADDSDHDVINLPEHTFVPSVNEVSNLYKRLKGQVIVKLQEDCIDLPELQYRIIECKPTQSIINAAKLIVARGESAIKTLVLLRELSDGFLYESKDIGSEECPLCNGNRSINTWDYCGPDDEYQQTIQDQYSGKDVNPEYFRKVDKACTYCDGTGEVIKYQREAVQVPCPKEDALNDLIDQHEEVGRLVTYAGFTGSVDRCVQAYIKQKWDVIRVDGRGWHYFGADRPDSQEMLRRFMFKQYDFPRVAFVAQGGAGGMGLNLVASPSIIYYSNDFNEESRGQSEKRIHRIGMDTNRGATIYDLFHLPTDAKILDNLKKKRRLQHMSMGDIRASLESNDVSNR